MIGGIQKFKAYPHLFSAMGTLIRKMEYQKQTLQRERERESLIC